MKINIQITFATLMVLSIAGCTGPKKKPSGTAETTPGVIEKQQMIEPKRSPEELYSSLPLLGLPLGSNPEFISEFQKHEREGDAVFYRLTGISEVASGYSEMATAFRLPQYDGKRFIITGTLQDKDEALELYSLSAGLNALDRLRIYSVEKINGGKGVINQTFSIDENYHITVSKRLDDVLIEMLTFAPSAAGLFEELRNGKTTTVAFDSYDGVNYYVQTFVWDHDDAGGLIKKDLRTMVYRIGEGGELTKD